LQGNRFDESAAITEQQRMTTPVGGGGMMGTGGGMAGVPAISAPTGHTGQLKVTNEVRLIIGSLFIRNTTKNLRTVVWQPSLHILCVFFSTFSFIACASSSADHDCVANRTCFTCCMISYLRPLQVFPAAPSHGVGGAYHAGGIQQSAEFPSAPGHTVRVDFRKLLEVMLNQ
jgi:hypothetical protein